MSDSLLADAVDIRRWLEADASAPYDTRLSRDRSIGRTIEATDDVERVRSWWRQVRDAESPPAGDSDGARLVGFRRLATTGLLLLGV